MIIGAALTAAGIPLKPAAVVLFLVAIVVLVRTVRRGQREQYWVPKTEQYKRIREDQIQIVCTPEEFEKRNHHD